MRSSFVFFCPLASIIQSFFYLAFFTTGTDRRDRTNIEALP
jgi:hypothetical protein